MKKIIKIYAAVKDKLSKNPNTIKNIFCIVAYPLIVYLIWRWGWSFRNSILLLFVILVMNWNYKKK